jgi:trehalose 6-phosphate phosphatase
MGDKTNEAGIDGIIARRRRRNSAVETSIPATEDLTGPPRLSPAAALYLDFDGTLVELAPRPDRVRVSPRLPQLLGALQSRQNGAVAIITGRPLAAVDALLAPAILAGAGVHGAELRMDPLRPAQMQQVPGIAPLAQALRERFASDARLLVEDKRAAVALHFRLAPERADECIRTMQKLAEIWNLEVIAGKCVIEARGRGVRKGRALRMLAARPPYDGRKPVFAGDDATDEDGFAAAAELGGYGVKVGAGKTMARYRCRTVEDLHDWLLTSLQADS